MTRRKKGKPLSFLVGIGSVIKGWCAHRPCSSPPTRARAPPSGTDGRSLPARPVATQHNMMQHRTPCRNTAPRLDGRVWGRLLTSAFANGSDMCRRIAQFRLLRAASCMLRVGQGRGHRADAARRESAARLQSRLCIRQGVRAARARALAQRHSMQKCARALETRARACFCISQKNTRECTLTHFTQACARR